MLIDPFVVVAQIVNFLILVALLKRFLYKPITQAMEVRAQRIEGQLAAAASKEQDAEAEKKLYLQKQQTLETQKQEWLNKVKQEVKLEKERLTENAIAEINLLRSQWYRDFDRDRQKLSREIRDRLSHQVTLATRKVLADLANANLEAQVIEAFIPRLSRLSEAQLLQIHSLSISNSDCAINICSSFVVPEDQRNELITVIKERIAADAKIQFEINSELICGIELRLRGYKISWNINDYLTELETATAKVLAENHNQRMQV